MFKWVMKTVGKEQPMLRTFNRDVLDHVEHELCVVVPFISEKAVREMVMLLDSVAKKRRKQVSIRLITAGDTQAYLLGDSELAAVKYLISLPPTGLSLAVEVRVITKLHAKVYLVPGKRGLVTSANLTLNGMRQNREAGILTEDTTILQQVERDLRTLWEVAQPVNIDQVDEAIREVQRWRREHSEAISVLEEQPDREMFRRDLALPMTKASSPQTTPQRAEIVIQDSGATPSTTEPPAFEVVRPRLGSVQIQQRGRHRLALELLSVAGGLWRLEIHRRGRPRGLAWESPVEPSGALQLSLIDNWLLLEISGNVTQVDLNTLEPVPRSVAVEKWDVAVHWRPHGQLFATGGNATPVEDGEVQVTC